MYIYICVCVIVCVYIIRYNSFINGEPNPSHCTYFFSSFFLISGWSNPIMLPASDSASIYIHGSHACDTCQVDISHQP